MLLEPQNAPVTLMDTVSDVPGATDALVTLADSFLMLLEPQSALVKLTDAASDAPGATESSCNAEYYKSLLFWGTWGDPKLLRIPRQAAESTQTML